MAKDANGKAAGQSYLDALKRERDRFVALAFCAADVLLEVNNDCKVTFAAGASKALMDHNAEALVGRSLTELLVPEDRSVLAELLRGMRRYARIEPVIVRLAGPRGPSVPLVLSGYYLPDLPNSYFFALRLSGADVVSGKGDGLSRDNESGLLKSESFARLADQKIRAARDRGQSLMLTMLRIPELAALRSRLDQEASESIVRTIGACLRVSSGATAVAGRFDERSFGLVHAPELDVADMKSRIETHVRAVDPEGHGVTVQAGTIAADAGVSAEGDLLKAVLYAVNKFCEMDDNGPAVENVSENLQDLVRDASHKMTSFRAVISADDFDIAFQPIVRIDTRRVHHFEALARFGGGSTRSPYELITFAESTGLICDFDFAMCRKVIAWLEASAAKGQLWSLAWNLSGRSVGNSSFLTALLKLLDEHESVRRQLVIEITESARIRDLTAANKFIQTLRKAGHIVCLDDFGAGASALRYLHDLDIDIVKIDGRYIRGAIRVRKVRAFLKAIASLCFELGISTVAEMVEDEATVDLVKQCRIEFGQGYLFGKPSTDFSVFFPGEMAAAQPAAKTAGRRPWQPDKA
jgi:EAL domain-containing protein (putative c-di-GMP-specific phosphodiesterase class I)/GGDEF domain-containing protein